jgi:predicted aconitase
LSTLADQPLTAVCLGTPHFSISEFESLLGLIGTEKVNSKVHLYVSTNRHTLAQLEHRSLMPRLLASGIELIADRCSYYAPVIDGCSGTVMTNSAKWACYAPSGLNAQVVFGNLEECVCSAITGRVQKDEKKWQYSGRAG